MTTWAKLTAIGLLLLALAGGVWKIRHGGVMAERTAQEAKAAALKQDQTTNLANFNENQRLIERAWSTQSQKAQNERAIKKEAVQPLLRSVSSELVGLRNDIYALDTNASGQPVSSCPARAATARAVFEQCAQRYSDLAGKADGHAADAVMLQNAWPN